MRAILAITVSGVSLIGLLSCDLRRGLKNYEEHAPQLRADLGFDHGSPYLKIDGKAQEVFTIESTVTEGVFDKSGVHGGDIVMGISILEFYEQLETNRGDRYTFSVVEGGDGPSLVSRTKRAISITIPPKR
jgi:hypothetical protein